LKRIVTTATAAEDLGCGRLRHPVSGGIVVITAARISLDGAAASALGNLHDGGPFPHQGTSVEEYSVSIFDLAFE